MPGFEKIPPVVHTGSNKRQFVIDRLNIANNFDYYIPLGIPVYANAIDVLKGVDIAYDSYVNEFLLGKKRIMVKPAATNYLDGEPVFDPDELRILCAPGGHTARAASFADRYDAENPASTTRGIQDQLNLLSSQVQVSARAITASTAASVATATQVISENSTMFRTIKKHEIILEQALAELCRIILRLGNACNERRAERGCGNQH